MKNPNRIHDLTGQRFGRLVVLGVDHSKQTRKTFWLCECDCGNFKSVRSDALLEGRTKSCGCLHKESAKQHIEKCHRHKMSGTRIYQTWQGMRYRCSNPKNSRYADYGGRGISVCDEWQDFTAFYEWAMANGYSDDLTIDRIDNDGNYCPENCRWATVQEQCRNRRSNIRITIGNTAKTLTEWCEIFNLDCHKVVLSRYHRMCAKGTFDLDYLFSANTEASGRIAKG